MYFTVGVVIFRGTKMLLLRNKVGAFALASVLLPGAAEAHVKWFCAFDVAGQPVGLANVLCQDFEFLVALSMILLVLGALIETTPLGTALLRSLDLATRILHRYQSGMIRLVAGGFFLSLWYLGNLYLTPELTAGSAIPSWVQLLIAMSMLSRRTLPLAGLGIAALFISAAGQYGMFHLMDYPIFLGLAAYLACIGLGITPFGIRPLDLLRFSAAITLMWASVEKWAYPQWTYPLFMTHPAMTMGFDVSFYLRAAGVVEFTLAFALMWTPLVRRISATILAGTFIGAIGEFGMIDAIGHSCIIAVLLALMADDARGMQRQPKTRWLPAAYTVALIGFLIGYYSFHAAMFGEALT